MSDSSINPQDRTIESQINEAIAEYLNAIETGQSVDRKAFSDAHPEVANELNEFFDQRGRFDQLVDAIRGQQVDLISPPVDGESVRVFGDYELLHEIARGGMGIVFKARQVSLNRMVALKMTLKGQVAGESERARFRAEAEAAAYLNHPNIVPIYEVGEHEGRQYFSMKLIEGGSLSNRLNETKSLSPTEAAKLTARVARAVHFAHQHGILHRDLKPANILLEETTANATTSELKDHETALPQLEPMITDFGLAKNIVNDLDLTGTGILIGTPNYMSPEQAQGDNKSLTTATDVYGLGAILYSGLTGQAPFHDTSAPELFRRLQQEPPQPPSKSNGKIDRDLDTICLKCLEKDPASRYRSAEDLADDLERYLTGQPINARPTPFAERAIKWTKRKPAIASLVAVSALAAILLIVGLIISNVLISNEQQRTAHAFAQVQMAQNNTAHALKELQHEQHQTSQALWKAYLAQAKAQRQSGNVGHRVDAIKTLMKAITLHEELNISEEQLVSVRSEFIAALAIPVDLRLVKTHQVQLPTDSFAFDSRLERFAIAWGERPLSIRSTADNQELCQIANGRNLPIGMQFAPRRKDLLLVSDSRPPATVKLWQLSSDEPKLIQEITADAHAFSNNGQFLAIAGSDKRITVFDLDTMIPHSGFEAKDRIVALDFDGTDNLLAIAGKNGRMMIVDAEFGTEKFSWTAPDQLDCLSLDWSPDGQQIALTQGDRIYLCEASTGNVDLTFVGHTEIVDLVQFHPTRQLLFSSGWDNSVRVWGTVSGQPLLKAVGQFGGLHENGRQLAILNNMRMQLWELELSDVLWQNDQHHANQPGEYSASFHPTLPLLATGGDAGVTIWNTDTRIQLAKIPLGPIRTVIFHPRSGELITGARVGLAKWPCKLKNNQLTIGPPQFFDLPSQFVPDDIDIAANGSALVADSLGYPWAVVIPWNDPAAFIELRGQPGLNSVSISADGSVAATGNYRGKNIVIWDCDNGNPLTTVPLNRSAWAVLNPDGDKVIGVFGKKSEFYSAQTGQTLYESDLSLAAYSHDGSMVAATTQERITTLADAVTGKQLARFESKPQIFGAWALSFSQDDTKLVRAAPHEGFHLWDLTSISSHLKAHELDWSSESRPIYSTAEQRTVDSVFVQLASHKPVEGQVVQIDLTSKINHKFDDQPGEVDDSLGHMFARLPHESLVELAGVKFKFADGLIESEIKSVEDESEPVLDVPIGLRVNKLHFLHNTKNRITSKDEIARYVVHYADGSSESIPIVKGVNIAHWNDIKATTRTTDASLAWLGATPTGDCIGLCIYSWINPHPKKTVANIDFVGIGKSDAAPFCVAISAELPIESD